jgi:ABC-2 type transport system permease protein
VEVLPDALQKLAIVSPATYVLDGTRQALLDGQSTTQLWPYIWPVVIMGFIAIPLGLWVFNLAERYAKRIGKLHRHG